MKAAFRDKAIFIYKQKIAGSGANSVSERSKANLRAKYTSGGLSQTAKKDINRLVANWQCAVTASQQLWSKGRERRRRYFVMITLTLCAKQVESDNVIKRKYLNVWLQNLERVHKGINWLWVAECQQNGNIHFHIIVDRYVRYEWIRRTWNRVLGNGTYIEKFQSKFGYGTPPSVNVEGQKHMNNPAAYITKYLTGDKYVRDIEGRKWGCCDKLRSIDRWGLICGDFVEDVIVREFANALKSVQYGEHSTAYFFDKGLVPNGVWARLLQVCAPDICRGLGDFYPELIDACPEDLPRSA